ncbi:hypothetical protein A3A70_00555 [candidate division WWE3 bacterium RIFCSPLOWO2_01_FULL_42_11]|uniref:Cell envelope-related transcriptional attenuator domain-containing protein n=1 Tax=candidate division WWE3 bacterium RIFCSPLOWO2_01_FULL_42_11 TaxID=1802627 RepID=A0A1F4VLZ6_UNCKA|nr:MAG: hypothetical protein A3A70_00555 [candidate division WWE3 bacterium RIFCSPLOWO2_01_FULL_42_11]
MKDLKKIKHQRQKNITPSAWKHRNKLIILVIIVTLGVLTLFKIGQKYPGVIPFGPSRIQETDGLTNILILGLDRRSEDMAPGGLNDTIIVASINKKDGKAVLTSIPRDLWVTTPKGYSGRVNTLYAVGGTEETSKILSSILGIPIHYTVVVDFSGFKKGIDTLGGIDVFVANTFDDFEYPIEGKENAEKIEDRYEHVHFDSGLQHMDGETALKYARSRHSEGEEGSDFARSERQKRVLLAAKDKALSLGTLANPIKLKELSSVFGASVDTDITINEAKLLIGLAQTVNNNNIVSATIDHTDDKQQTLLFSPKDLTPYGGAWVLIPTNGDFRQVQEYMHNLLFTNQEDGS